MNNINLKQLEKRIYQHTFEDGLLEIIMGIWLGILSVYFWVDWSLAQPTTTIYMLLMLGLPLSLGPGLRLLKKGITAPRIGYMKYPDNKKTRKQRLIMVTIGLIAILLMGAIAFWAVFSGLQVNMAWLSGILFFIAAIYAAGFFYMAAYYQIPRFYIVGSILILVGFTVSLMQVDFMLGLLCLTITTGVLCFLSGLVTLIGFLRNNPVVEEAMVE